MISDEDVFGKVYKTDNIYPRGGQNTLGNNGLSKRTNKKVTLDITIMTGIVSSNCRKGYL